MVNYDNLKTPFYRFNASVLDAELASLESAVAEFWPHTVVGYSVKTNSLPFLACHLRRRGVWAEVVSADEYDMVRACGYGSDAIVCNGPIKSEELLEKLLGEHTLTHLDSQAEVERVERIARADSRRELAVGLRVNIDLEPFFPGESNAGAEGSRFGFSVESGEFGAAVERLKALRNVKIESLHLHLSTRTRSVEIYRKLAEIFADVVRDFGLEEVRYFDIGGGFFGGMPDKPSWRDYLKGISETLRARGFDDGTLTLVLEPGVSLLAGALSYFMRIVDVKRTSHGVFAVADGSRIHVDPLFHKSSYFYEREGDVAAEVLPRQTLAGFTCLENDRFFTLENAPALCVGELIRFDKVGAYTNTFSPLFISYFPPVYRFDEEGRCETLRERWSAKEFVQLSKID